jgi:threonine/homoserine/homoserine lactone efflux protein
LGLAFCASPGALNAEALRRGLARGFSSAFLVEVGSLIGDATWAVIGLTGAAYLVKYHLASVALASLGSTFLFWLAFRALRDAWRGTRPLPRPESRHSDFAAGALISLTNPYSVAFWMGLGGAVSLIGSGRPLMAQYAAFLGAFMLGATLWCLIVSAIIGWGRRVVKPPIFRLINGLCGTALAYAGVRLVVRMVL